jgi:hypothetical protein
VENCTRVAASGQNLVNVEASCTLHDRDRHA